MSPPSFDKNQWYHLYVNEDKKQALMGTSLFNKGGTHGAVFFNTTNTATNVQRWQVYPVTVNDITVYIFRCKDGGPNGFMGTAYVETEATDGETRPQMLRGDIANENVYWSFGSWGDGTWFLTNAANTTDYHLNKKGNGLLAMSSNTTAPQNGQRWGFETIDKIDDEQYSSVNLVGIKTSISKPTTVYTTSFISLASAVPSASPTTSADSRTNSTSSGLSTGIKIAIGAVTGSVSLLLLIILGLYFYKKRTQRVQYSKTQEMPHDIYFQGDASTTRYEMHHDGSAKYEMPSSYVAEVPNHHPATELPAYTPEAQRRYPG
ncbi:hypothetical protein CC86DRAFT_144642 [Ophiobolus disseminans]|uniref:Ricin B lectin domain-containing protein n=1 Tax=Ophiobolus disseminans TaxID=1469910 RepID=A0A6A6ZDX5_9PLEO|nr:hypothetical protein CC86DRAFT_144642 [Ophiobolus disseminans]